MRRFIPQEKRVLIFVVLVTAIIYFAFFFPGQGSKPSTTPQKPLTPVPPPVGPVAPVPVPNIVEQTVEELRRAAPCQSRVRWTSCHTDRKAHAMQLAGLTDKSGVSCDQTGVCRCHRQDEIFFGPRCIPRGDWTRPYEVLRKKWHEVPMRTEVDNQANSGGIGSSRDMLKYDDDTLKKTWLSVRPQGDCLTDLFVEKLKGKKVIDIGAGFARQSLQIALGGAHVTFLDVVQTNLKVIERLCGLFGISERCQFLYLEDLSSLSALEEYDAMLAFGTQHHMPREFIEEQYKVVLPHLKVGGIWWQLAYPVNRWGSGDFRSFGQATDGASTPWGEWYEPGKLLTVMGEAGVTMEMDWCGIINDSEFNWFGLRRTA